MRRIKRMLIVFLISFTGQMLAQSPPAVSGISDICDGSTTILTTSGESGATFDWYLVPTGGSSIFTGSEFTTPPLSSDTDYYVEQTTGAGTSARTLQTVQTNPIPDPLQPVDVLVSPSTICEGESASLSATVDVTNNQVVYWYDSPSGGNVVAVTDSEETFTVKPVATTTYYAQSIGMISHSTTTVSYGYTGAPQSFIVPDGVYRIDIDAAGARSGKAHYFLPQGMGGRVQTSLQVTPGQELHIYVGGQGSNVSGGWNGGGQPTSNSNTQGGGGATDIRVGGTSLYDRVVVAGGAGGGGFANGNSTLINHESGHGGGLRGGHGWYYGSEGNRGKGGTQTEGGRRGCVHTGESCGTSGTFGVGGNSGSVAGWHGGAGGGGWYGGGGATNTAQGGGGSSYTHPVLCSSASHTRGYQNGNGFLRITYQMPISCGNNNRVPVTLTVNPNASLNTIDSIVSCPGLNVELSASGADQYLWQPGNLTGDTILVNPIVSTTYTLIGSQNNSSCNDTTDIHVSINQVAINSIKDTLCLGESLELNAEGEASAFIWTPGNLSGSTINIMPTETTTYILEGLHASGCSSFDTIEMVVIPNSSEITIATPDTTIPANSYLELNASAPGSDSIVWSTGAYGPTAGVVLLESAAITATGYSLGCSDVDTVNISVQQLAQITGVTIIEAGNSTTLQANTPDSTAANFAWYDAPVGGNLLSSSDTYTTPSLTTNTTYYVEIDDGSGVSLRKPIQINVIALDSLSADQDTICPGDHTNLSGTLPLPGSINWYDNPTGGTLLGTTNSNEPFNVSVSRDSTFYAAGATYLQVDSFSFTGAVQTFTVPDGVTSIKVNAFGGEGGLGRILSNGTRSGVGGLGGQVETTLDVTPGEILHIYVGGKGGQMEQGDTDPNFGGWNGGGNPPGHLAGGGGGATDIRSGGTNLSNRIIVAGGGGGGSGHFGCPTLAGKGGAGGGTIGGTGTNCQNNADEAGGGTQTGHGALSCDFSGNRCGYVGTFGMGGNGYNYTSRTGGGGGGGWYGGNGGGIYSTGGGGSSFTHPDRCANVIHHQGVHSGDGLLVISYSLDATAITREALTIAVETIQLSADKDTICSGSAVELMASGSDNYTWTPGNVSGDQQTFSPLSTTTYVVEALGNDGCQIFDSITIVLGNLLETTKDTTVLINALTTLSSFGADSIVWSNGIEGSFNEVFITKYSQFVVTGYEFEFGCVEVDTVNINIGEMPLATGTTIILKGTSTTLIAEPPFEFRGSVSYRWYDAFEGGNLLSTSDTYVTPPLNNNMVYFVEMTDGAYTTMRKCITVNVVDAESLTVNAEQDTFCLGENTNLSGTMNHPGLIHWYDASTGGNLLETTGRNEDYNISPSSTTTYYASGETQAQIDSFHYIGAVQTFTVPEGVTSIVIDAYGGAGGDGPTDIGGDGGRVEATLNVTPGEVLHLYVGGKGEGYVSGDTQNNDGGWNGGGNITDILAGGGGGASDIRIGGMTLTHRILVAGGGGGGSGYWCDAPVVGAGAGGGTTGGDGDHCWSGSGTDASGGTQTGRGPTISCDNTGQRCGQVGTFGNGGDGYFYEIRSGGAGGGGWYGGNGGGIYANGGGGSSYTHPDRCANVVHTQGVNIGDGLIILTYSLDDNTATRTPLTIDVGDFEAPVPDVTELPTEIDDISVTLTAPTAMDDCAGVLTATTADPTTYTTPGIYTVTWEYDDGNGHLISQQQMVIVGNNLPVELLHFTGHKRKAEVVLDWATASELDSRGFEIQRSSNGLLWESLGFVYSRGNSTNREAYQFNDTNPLLGINYYRLLLLDQDGSVDYSTIVQVKFELGTGKIQVFPNPTSTDQFTVVVDDLNFTSGQAVNIAVYNRMGQKVLEQPMDQNRIELMTSEWPAGHYIVRVNSGMFSWNAKVVVLKN